MTYLPSTIASGAPSPLAARENTGASDQAVLTLSCPQRSGIVHSVSRFLFERGFDIVEHQQFDDPAAQLLYLRTAFVQREKTMTASDLARDFSEVANEFSMDFNFHDGTRPKALIMVSKMGHCLNDLIFRWTTGTLAADLVAVVSNHENLRTMAESAGIPFIHIPVTAETKPEAEARLLGLIDDYSVDLVVLARYMQILSPELSTRLSGRAINIHHSFLPGFKGARPYHQAHTRGVKQIGATAHYVTDDLDEGPIIEQEVIRVDHRLSPQELAMVGRGNEALALSKAVRLHVENRVMVDGLRTITFT